MALYIPTIGSERERKKRAFTKSPIDSICLNTIIGPAVGDGLAVYGNETIQRETVEKSTRIMSIIYDIFSQESLYLDSFQTQEGNDPARKFFMAGELVNNAQERECLGDIVIHNGMVFLANNDGERAPNEVQKYIGRPTKMNLELPLGVYIESTIQAIRSIWGDIDGFERSSKNDAIIVHVDRSKDVQGISREDGVKVLQKLGLGNLPQKKLIGDDLIYERLIF